ncbi:MAG TPA: response regulator transcription factor [Desulfobulbus sp.]|nr:response regulator transcription factor [Desulfobulbus sp.]
MITAFLADDHQMFRQGLRTLLASTKDIQVIGEASNGQESLRLIEELQPEVAVLDIAMPGLTGIEVARRLARVAPKTKNLILTMHADCFYAVEALKANALGFMLKEESFDMLINAIRAVAAGNMFVSPTLEKPVLKEFVGLAKQSGVGGGNILTEREREILQLVVEGLTNQEISKKLCISTSTVDTHRKNIMAKLDIHSIAGLVKYAIRHKIVTL